MSDTLHCIHLQSCAYDAVRHEVVVRTSTSRSYVSVRPRTRNAQLYEPDLSSRFHGMRGRGIHFGLHRGPPSRSTKLQFNAGMRAMTVAAQREIPTVPGHVPGRPDGHDMMAICVRMRALRTVDTSNCRAWILAAIRVVHRPMESRFVEVPPRQKFEAGPLRALRIAWRKASEGSRGPSRYVCPLFQGSTPCRKVPRPGSVRRNRRSHFRIVWVVTPHVRQVRQRTPVPAVFALQPDWIPVERRSLLRHPVDLHEVVAMAPYRPPAGLPQSGRVPERVPPRGKEEPVIRSGLDRLAVFQNHPEDRLHTIAVNLHDTCVPERKRVFVDLPQLHLLDALAAEKRVPLLVGPGPVPGRLESAPDLLDGQLVELAATSRLRAGQVEVHLSPLGQAGRTVPYPLPCDEHRHRAVELELDHLRRGCGGGAQVADQPPVAETCGVP